MKSSLFFLTFLLISSLSNGQSGYLVGSSKVSIEPDTSVFSVALAGYAAPRDGRFSIEWIYKDSTPSVRAITGLGGCLYAVDEDNNFWTGIFEGDGIRWKRTGRTSDAIALAGMNKRLYAVTDGGSLEEGRITSRGIRWHKKGIAPGVKTLAALGGRLYGTNGKNDLLSLDLSDHHESWVTIGHAADSVLGMSGHNGRLYAVNAGDTLWRIEPSGQGVPWTEIGRYNGVTYHIHAKQIAVSGNRLYAISDDNELYESRNNSDGNLSATALAVKKDDKTVVMVGADLTGFNHSLIMDIKQEVYRTHHIPPAAILINAAHDHFAPVTQSWITWENFYHHPDSNYLKVVKKGIIDAIDQALDNMSPADLLFGRGRTNIGLNRHAANPEIPHDKTLDVIEAKGLDGDIKNVLFLTGCHVVFKNAGREGFTISANFPGVTRKLIREKTGANAVFIQGCGGDINPRSLDHVKTGTELAADVFKILDNNMQKLSGGISYSIDTILIPVKPWSIEKINQFKEENINHVGNVHAEKNVRWANLMLKRYADGTVSDVLPEYIQMINLGNWKLVGMSREAVTEYGPAVRKMWPDKMVSVAGYCNDVSSYLPKEWHVVMQTYEGHESFFWYGQPGLPPINIFDIVVNGIRALK